MRVLVITSHKILNEESGTPKHIRKILIGLSSRNLELCVIHLETRSKHLFNIFREEYNEFEVHTLPLLRWITESRKLIKEFQPDAFLIFTNGAACRFLPLLWLYKVPLLYEVHTVFSPFSAASLISSIYSGLEKIVCKRADHIVVLGETVRGIYYKKRKVEKDRVSVIYPGVKLDDFEAISNQASALKTDKASINVTYLGNLIYGNHGIDYLLQAAMIVGSKSEEINFYLVGKPDNAETKYEKLLCNDSRVTFIYTDDIGQIDLILNNSDIFVHTRIPSRHNLSVQSKFAVYMACGKPVVITDFADYGFFIENYKCGYAVKLIPEDIAAAVLDLADNRDLRLEMGRNSLELARTHFDLNENIDRYIEILKSMV